MAFCLLDIQGLDEYVADYRKEWPEPQPLPHFPSIKRLAIIQEKRGLIKDAISTCEYAIEHRYHDHDTKGGYAVRLEKLKRKLV